MSDLNNKHIPEDLDTLTRKDMVELYKLQMEEHQEFLKTIKEQAEQLSDQKLTIDRLDEALEEAKLYLEERAVLRDFLKRYRYRIKGGEAMQKTIDGILEGQV